MVEKRKQEAGLKTISLVLLISTNPVSISYNDSNNRSNFSSQRPRWRQSSKSAGLKKIKQKKAQQILIYFMARKVTLITELRASTSLSSLIFS